MPLFYLSIAFLAGIAVSSGPGLSLATGFWLAGSGLGIALAALGLFRVFPGHPGFAWAAERYRVFPPGMGLSPDALSPVLLAALPGLLTSAFGLGAVRELGAHPDLSDPGHVAAYVGRPEPVSIVGLLAAPPDIRDRWVHLRVAAESLRPRDTVQHIPVRGLVQVRAMPGGSWRYGDRIVVTGVLETPPEMEGFSYRAYLARQHVYAYMGRAEPGLLESGQGKWLATAVFRLKDRAMASVYELFPDPEASLLAGILLGVETGMAPDLKKAFQNTGTSHIIAISGFNISILAGMFAALFGRLPGIRTSAGKMAGDRADGGDDLPVYPACGRGRGCRSGGGYGCFCSPGPQQRAPAGTTQQPGICGRPDGVCCSRGTE
jgi:competence protein ComEC